MIVLLCENPADSTKAPHFPDRPRTGQAAEFVIFRISQ
jgi:hypothetical protein